MAELFWWCEVVKPSFVQPRTVNTKGNTVSLSVKFAVHAMYLVNAKFHICSFIAFDPSQFNNLAPIPKQNLIHRPGSPDQSRFVFNTMEVLVDHDFMQEFRLKIKSRPIGHNLKMTIQVRL